MIKRATRVSNLEMCHVHLNVHLHYRRKPSTYPPIPSIFRSSLTFSVKDLQDKVQTLPKYRVLSSTCLPSSPAWTSPHLSHKDSPLLLRHGHVMLLASLESSVFSTNPNQLPSTVPLDTLFNLFRYQVPHL